MLLEILSQPDQKQARAQAGTVCQTMLSAAKKAKTRFDKTAGEIMRYCYADDFSFEYTNLPDSSFFQAKVAKSAEALQIFGPMLYSNNPHRQTNPRKFASERAIERSEVMSDYLNYTPNECGFKTHARYATDQSIITGAGVLWTGYDEKKRLVTSKHDSISNLYLDPDATMYDEMRYVIRRRVEPKWELLKKHPEWKKAINQLTPCAQRKSNSTKTNYYSQTDQTAECVEYYEIYMKVGLHHYKGGEDLAKMVQAADPEMAAMGETEVDDSPLKYLIGENGLFIGVENWEVPFFLDNEFPCTILSYFHEDNSIYPVSPLKNGLGFQRAMNWIVTLMMGKYHFTSRSTLAFTSQNGSGLDDGAIEQILNGGAIEAIKMQINGDGMKLSDFIHQFEWKHDYIQYGKELLSEMEMQFEKSTGLYSVLYTGEGQRQSRSAKDAQIKDERSSSRINDMRDAGDEFHSKVARKEAMAARFLHSRKDITEIFGKQYGDQWGLLIKPDEEVAQNFFEQAMQAGLPPEQAQAMVQELMENATSMDKWMHECDYSIEAGSTRRKDADQHIDTLKESMNQTVPTLLQSMDLVAQSMAYEIMAEYYKAIGLPDTIVDKLTNYAQLLQQTPQQPGVPPELPPQ